MAKWGDVMRLASIFPDARLGEAHEGSPAWFAGCHQFARLRYDDARGVLQFWSGDMDLASQLAARRDVFFRFDTFSSQVSVWAWLDKLDDRELAELLLDSYRIRGGKRRGERVDEEAYFAGL